MMPFRDRLRTRRQRLGLRQRDVARIIGHHVNTVARWERGLFEPALPVQRSVLQKLYRISGKTG